MKAVTHNVLHTTDVHQTTATVRTALKERPQIAAFQEFDPRDDLAIDLVGHPAKVGPVSPAENDKKPYLICRAQAKGLPILLRVGYVKEIRSIKTLTLVPAHGGVRTTLGTEVLFVNRHGLKVAVLNTHPVAHHEKPEYKKAFKDAIDAIESWAHHSMMLGYTAILMMDGNGAQTIRGLTSCWVNHDKLPTGPGGFTIDGVWTTAISDEVKTFETASDHNGVLARYARFGLPLIKH